MPGRERHGVVAREAHAHELRGAPALDALELRLDDFLFRSIHPQYPLTLSGIAEHSDLPLRGDLHVRMTERATESSYWIAAAPSRLPHGGEEVRLRVDAVLGAELERASARAR